MNKAIGVVLLVVGIVLLVQGHNISQSINSQFKQMFTGSPTDKATYYYLGGGVASCLGLFLMFYPGGKRGA